MPTRTWLLLLTGVALLPAQPPTDSAALLGRVRRAVANHLAELPNYTCDQTIERSTRPVSSRRYQPLDTIRLEVAYVGGRELFGWPGAGRFEDKRIDQMVPGGAAIGNGFFAAHARAVFLTGAPTYTYGGESVRNGRKCLRYDYRIPREKSEFVFRDGNNNAVVGYHGSFWVDADNLDLLVLEVQVDQFPAGMNASRSGDLLEYGRVHIGDRDFLLPQSAEMTIVDLKGNESRNVTRMKACRQYVGESVLKFGDEPASQAAGPANAPRIVEIPAGLEIDAAIATPFGGGNTAVGDPVSATVLRDAKKDGMVFVPKGAKLSGRITRLGKRRTRGFEFFLVGLAFFSFEADGRRGEFLSSLDDAGSASNAFYAPLGRAIGRPLSIWSGIRHDVADVRPGEGILYVRGDVLRVPAGLRIGLTTQPKPAE